MSSRQLFSNGAAPAPIRVDPDGSPVMPEWSDADESWHPIKDAPAFKMSRDGRVRDPDGDILRPNLQQSGQGFKHYCVVIGSQNRSISDLVLETFVGPRPEADMVPLHRDDNPLNDTIDNLRWGWPRSKNVVDADKASSAEHAAEVADRRGTRVAKELQPDATQMDSVTQARDWLDAHPEEAEMLRQAQVSATGDILADSGVPDRWYSSTEAAAFFDKTVQWLYWGMRHPPNGGRLFVEPRLGPDGTQERMAVDDVGNEVAPDDMEPDVSYDMVPAIDDIPVVRLGDPVTGKRRFDIPTIRKFATSAYYRGNIKEPKLIAVLQRLVVAERGGNWMAVPIPSRADKEESDELT